MSFAVPYLANTQQFALVGSGPVVPEASTRDTNLPLPASAQCAGARLVSSELAENWLRTWLVVGIVIVNQSIVLYE